MVYSKEEVTILEKGKTTKHMLLLDGTVVNIEFLYGTFLMTISFIINNIKLSKGGLDPLLTLVEEEEHLVA